MKRIQILIAAIVLAALLATLLSPFTVNAAPAQTAGGSGCAQFYVVRPGDNLFRIALRFNTTITALVILNGLPNANLIYSGMTLCLRAGAPLPFGFLYSVRYGDTLYAIAHRYGWSIWYLASVNHLPNVNYIRAGQVLLIPYH